MLREIEIVVNFMTLRMFFVGGFLNKWLNIAMLTDVLIDLLKKKHTDNW